MKIGQKVRIDPPELIAGEVVDVEWDKDAGQPRALVRWVNASGETHERWFVANEINEVA